MPEIAIPVIDQKLVTYDGANFPGCFGAEKIAPIIRTTSEMLRLLKVIVLGAHPNPMEAFASLEGLAVRLETQPGNGMEQGYLSPLTYGSLANAMLAFQNVMKKDYSWFFPLEVRKCLVMTGIRWTAAFFPNAASEAEIPGTFFHWFQYQTEHALGSLIPEPGHEKLFCLFDGLETEGYFSSQQILSALYFFLTSDGERYLSLIKPR